jgi:hypothetical protein
MVEEVTENNKGVYKKYKTTIKRMSHLLQAYFAYCLQKHVTKSLKGEGLMRYRTALDNRLLNKVRAKFTNHTGLWQEKEENNAIHLSLQVEQVT